MANEEENEATEPAPAKGGPGILMVLIVALMSVAAGAGGAYFMIDQKSVADPGTAAGEAAAEGEEPAEPVSYQDRLLSLEPFIVNVGGDGFARFLKLKIELEADSIETRDELDARRPQVRDTVILLLSSKRLADVAEFEGKSLLKDDIGQRVNDLLPDGKVESVMFTEFVVQ